MHSEDIVKELNIKFKAVGEVEQKIEEANFSFLEDLYKHIKSTRTEKYMGEKQNDVLTTLQNYNMLTDFAVGNVVKYVVRVRQGLKWRPEGLLTPLGTKVLKEDLLKAAHYIQVIYDRLL